MKVVDIINVFNDSKEIEFYVENPLGEEELIAVTDDLNDRLLEEKIVSIDVRDNKLIINI